MFLRLIKRRFRCLWYDKVFTELEEVFGFRRRSSCWFREYLGREALHQTVKRTAQKERVGEGLVRRCVAEEIGKRLGAREVEEYLDKLPEPERVKGVAMDMHKPFCQAIVGVIQL